jgi:hypothetical protein
MILGAFPQPAAARIETRRRRVRESAARLAYPLAASLLGLGVIARLTGYLLNPPLSNDETQLALNLMDRSYGGLLSRLDFNQAAPPGFLMLEKLVLSAFGTSPLALRLLPLIAGVAICFVAYRLVVELDAKPAALLAAGLVAFSSPLVDYASTSKQYSSDALVSAVLFLVMLRIRGRFSVRGALILMVAGPIAVFVSYPAAFVLAAMWGALTVENAVAWKWRRVVALIAVGVVWAASVLAAYVLTLASIHQIQRTSGQAWMSSWSLAARTIGGIARYLISIPDLRGAGAAVTAVAVAVALVGLKALSVRSAPLAWVFIGATCLAGAAILLGLYPAFARTFVFMAPAVLLLVALSVCAQVSRGRGVIIAFVVLLIGLSVYGTIARIQTRNDLGPPSTLRFLLAHARPGDTLYVSRTAQYAFRYYVECGCLTHAQRIARQWPYRRTAGYGQFEAAFVSKSPLLIAGSSTGADPSDYKGDFAAAQKRHRVWVLLNDPSPGARSALLAFLRLHAHIVRAFPSGGAGTASILLCHFGREA